MNTSCIFVEIVDSDFAILRLYSNHSDEVIIGDSSGYGIEGAHKGERWCWEPLIADGKTWEQLSKAWENNEVLVEDTICGLAPLLGIESKYMASDYRDLSDNAERDKNIITLYFTKAIDGVKRRPMSLSAAFVKVFGEALEPLGFKKIKSKYPYFVRVINGEIIHVITYRNESPRRAGEKFFNVLGGVFTIYRDSIVLSSDPIKDNTDWLEDNFQMYRKVNVGQNVAFKNNIFIFSYKPEDESTMICELKRALDITNQVILPFISEAVDIDSCIKYLLKTGKIAGFDERGEGLLYLMTDNYVDIIEDNIKMWQNIYKRNLDQQIQGYTQDEYEIRCQRFDEVKLREISPIEKILTNPELSVKYTDELEHRKAINIEKMKTYGIIV